MMTNAMENEDLVKKLEDYCSSFRIFLDLLDSFKFYQTKIITPPIIKNKEIEIEKFNKDSGIFEKESNEFKNMMIRPPLPI